MKTFIFSTFAVSLGAILSFLCQERPSPVQLETKGREEVSELFKKIPVNSDSGLVKKIEALAKSDLQTRKLLVQQAELNTVLLKKVQGMEVEMKAMESNIEKAMDSRVYQTEWIKVKPNEVKENLVHDLTGMPLVGAVWAASDEAGKDAFLIDSIYENSGYGSWIIDVTEKHFSVATGPIRASASYGKRNHYDILGKGTREIYIKVVLMK